MAVTTLAFCTAPAVFLAAALLGALIFRFSPARRQLCCCTGIMVAAIFGIAVIHGVFHSFFAYSTVAAKMTPPIAAKIEAKVDPIVQQLQHPFVDFVADFWRTQYSSIDSRVTDPKFKDTMQIVGIASGIVTPVIFMFVYLCHLFGMRLAVPLQLAASVWMACGLYAWDGAEIVEGMPHVPKDKHFDFAVSVAFPVFVTVMLFLTSLLTLCCCSPKAAKEESSKQHKASKKSQ